MNTGLLLALLAAAAWAVNSIMVRKITAKTGEAFTSTVFSLFTGTLLFFLILLFKDELSALTDISLSALIKMSIAGIIANMIGRYLNYNSIRLIGANKAGTLIATTPFFTIIFALLFLNESLGIYLICGIILIIFGVILVSFKNNQNMKLTVISSQNIIGIIIALVTAVSYGSSSVLIKSAINELKSPFISVFLLYSTSTVFVLPICLKKENRDRIKQVVKNSIIRQIIAAGIITSVSGLLFQAALTKIPVSIASPLLSTNILMVYVISYFTNRRLEIFTWKILLGMISVVCGVFFIFQK